MKPNSPSEMANGNLSHEYSFYNRGKGALFDTSCDRCATFASVVTLNGLQIEGEIREKEMLREGYECGVAFHSASMSAPCREEGVHLRDEDAHYV